MRWRVWLRKLAVFAIACGVLGSLQWGLFRGQWTLALAVLGLALALTWLLLWNEKHGTPLYGLHR